MRWGVLVLAVAACADEPAPIPVPLEYTVSTYSADPDERPPATTPPAVYINGYPVTSLTMVFDSREDANGATYVVEMRHGDRVVDRVERAVLDNYPLERAPDSPWAYTSLCTYDNGDIRFSSESAYGGGIADSFCWPACAQGYCRDGLRCASRIMSISPLASHLACVPIGPKQRGDACSLVADGDTAYDDCGEQLVCVDGTCRALCRADSDCTGTSCAYVMGHAPEVRVCQ